MHKSTNFNLDPHAPDGSLDPVRGKQSVEHGLKMLESGQEIMIGAHQVPLADGSYLTIYHHKPA